MVEELDEPEPLEVYWPTTAWLDVFQEALTESEAMSETMGKWGVRFNGDFIFEITDLPIQEREVQDLPPEVWQALEMGITQLPESTLDVVLEDAPEVVQEGIEAREGPLPERAAQELLETKIVDAPDRVWQGLRRVMPEIMDQLLDQLEENVTDDGDVYAFIGLKGGDCYETGTLDTLDEREVGFILTGHYDDWVDLVSGDLDVIEGVMSGTLTVEGDMQKLLQYMDGQIVMTDVAAQLDKRFLF